MSDTNQDLLDRLDAVSRRQQQVNHDLAYAVNDLQQAVDDSRSQQTWVPARPKATAPQPSPVDRELVDLLKLDAVVDVTDRHPWLDWFL